jgi:hypothetical protein
MHGQMNVKKIQISQFYTQLSGVKKSNTTILQINVYILSDPFTLCYLCVKVAKLVLYGIILMWFPDVVPLRIDTRRNTECDII